MSTGQIPSIQRSGDSGDRFEVSHRWQGTRHTVSGAIEGVLIAESDFGQIKIAPDQLQRLTCTDVSPWLGVLQSSKWSQEQLDKALNTGRATLTTTEGSVVPVTNLAKVEEYEYPPYTSRFSRNTIPATYRHTNHEGQKGRLTMPEPVFAVELAGGTSLEVDLKQPSDNIARLELADDDTVVLTSRRGQQVTGTFRPSPDSGPHPRKESPRNYRLVGFTGFGPHGNFYIPREHVRAIAFDNAM